MFQYLALTDGTTIINLTDNINYALVGYAPVVAPLRDSELGGSGPYEDVPEQIVFHAIGCTAAVAYAAAKAVNDLLDQAQRWWRGENVSAVRLLIQAQGSTLDPLQVAVKGRAPGAPPNLALPATWNATSLRYVIQGITIQFVRRGQLISTDSAPAASASAAAPAIHSVTFSDNQTLSSPAKVTIGGLSSLAAAFSGFLAITDSASDMALIEAESLAFPANSWNSVADATARGGNILRWARNSTSFTASASTGGTTVAARTYAVYATVRNNSATMAFLLRLAVKVGVYTYSTTPVPIDTSTTNPRVILLGIVVLPEYTAVTNHGFAIEAAQAASGAGHTIDIDTLLVVNLDDEMSRVIAISNFALTGGTSLIVDDQILTKPVPSVGDTAQVPPYYTAYGGVLPLASKGTSMAACLFATQGANWLIKNTTPATVQTNLTAVRHTAYLVPS